MDVVKSLFERLQYEEDKLPALLDGKAYLVNMNETTLKEIITARDINLVFECLESTNEEQISTTVFILKMLLPVINTSQKLEVLSDRLRKGLDHSDSSVRHLCLREFQECSVTEEGNRILSNDEEVLNRIIKLVSDDDMTIALQASEVLAGFGSYCLHATNVLLTGGPLASLKSVMLKNDSVRYRVYDAIIKIQAKSEHHLVICIQSNIIQQLVKELSGDDILIRINCIAALSEMAFVKHSLNYLRQSGVVEKLIQMITNASSEPLSDLYMPEIVKFFGKMCHQEGAQNIVEIFPQFVPTLFSMVEQSDPVKKKIAIETIGFIGSNVEGKHVLAKMGISTLRAVGEISSVIRSVGNELRLIAINAMCELLDVKREQQTDDVLGLALQWFQCISDEPVDTIMSLCKQPFTGIKCGGLHMIKTLANLPWGMEALVEFPTFTEYILDRTSDNDKESKDARFEAIQALADSPHCKHIFGNNNWLKFRTYVKEGPFYTEAVPSVSIEEI